MQRGYDAEFRKNRAKVLAFYKYRCHRQGCTGKAAEVDHIRPRSEGGTSEEHNLVPLCRKHHFAKTAKENADRNRAKAALKYRPAPRHPGLKPKDDD